MRIHGALTRWNDDRGFGFITPAKGPPDVFVHISAFPRGDRPRLNELVSFEVESAADGRRRAVRIMRPGTKPRTQGPIASRRAPSNRQSPYRFGAREMIALAAIAVGIWGTFAYRQRIRPIEPLRPQATTVASAAHYSCDGRTMCSQMTSCDEAKYFIRHCPDTKMDGDHDGVPCESQWCDD